MSKKSKLIRVKLIVNPGAGIVADTSTHMNLVTNFLKKNGYQVDVAMAKPKEKATTIARKAVKKGYKMVIAMGGDGTLEAVMRGMVDSKVRLGIIPTGTENNIAMSLGIPRNLDEALEMVVSDHTVKLDMGQAKTKKGKKLLFFEMATIGLSAAIFPAASKVADGKLSGIKDAAVKLIHHETKPVFSLIINDESKLEVETMLVMVSNTPVFGKNFLVAPQASLQDGLLDISVYPGFSKVELLGYYAAVMNGGYSGNGKVQQYQARKLVIKSDPKEKVMADGIALGKGTVTIKVHPEALRVVAPKIKKNPIPEVTPKEAPVSANQPVSAPVENDHREVSVIKLG